MKFPDPVADLTAEGAYVLTPNESFDGGFGIFQITNPKPTAQQIWSWKANPLFALDLRGGVDAM